MSVKTKVDITLVKKYQKIVNLLRNPQKVKSESMILLNRFIKSLPSYERKILEYNSVFEQFKKLIPGISLGEYTMNYYLGLGRIDFDLSSFQDATLGSDLDITLDRTFYTYINNTGYALRILAYHRISAEEELLLRQIGVIRTVMEDTPQTIVQCKLPDAPPTPVTDDIQF